MIIIYLDQIFASSLYCRMFKQFWESFLERGSYFKLNLVRLNDVLHKLWVRLSGGNELLWRVWNKAYQFMPGMWL